jgi:DNA gyrase/topoisomerase IV subunit B
MRSTRDGTHIAGLWRGFRDHARAIESPAQTRGHVAEAIGSGLVAIIHVQLDNVRFAGCTRERLTNREAYDAVRTAVASSLRGWRARAIRRFVNERLAVYDANRGH